MNKINEIGKLTSMEADFSFDEMANLSEDSSTN
jgi:hypothetical protein